MTTEVEELWRKTFEQCAAFVRDTTLRAEYLEKYQVGVLLKEPTFCDASYKIGGFVAPHRFLIISSNARCLDEATTQSWGLCIWERGSFFKVIDRICSQNKSQITLLEVPEKLLEYFARPELSEPEQSLVMQARECFAQCVNADAIAELDTEAWRQRLLYPLGIDDHGQLYPGANQATPQTEGRLTFEIDGTSPTGTGDEILVADEIRRGDIVWFERIESRKLVMRVLSPDMADTFSGKRYRIDRGSQAGVIKLVEEAD